MICVSCIGLRYITVTPEGRGWLRVKRFETEQDQWHGVRIYELPNGELYNLQRPWRLRVCCPQCNPRRVAPMQPIPDEDLIKLIFPGDG